MSFSELTVLCMLRIGLHDDAILVRLGVDGGDDALPEGIVECVVDRRGGDAESGGGVAIDLDLRGQTLVQIVGGDVAQLRRAAATAPAASAPTAAASALLAAPSTNWYCARLTVDSMVRSCTGCRYSAMPGTPRAVCAQSRHDALDVVAALVLGLEVDQHAAVVERGVGAVDADERGQAHHVRIASDRGRECLLALDHGVEGHGRRCLGHALQQAGVLHAGRSPSGSRCTAAPSAPACRRRPTVSGADARAPTSSAWSYLAMSC